MELPEDFQCPITCEIFRDPVVADDGMTYERDAILRWFQSGHRTSPKTGKRLGELSIKPNHALRNSIETFLQRNKKIREQIQRLDALKRRIHAQPRASLQKFIDPISLNIMRDPVSFPSIMYTFKAISIKSRTHSEHET